MSLRDTALYKSKCRPTHLSVNEMLHFTVVQSGIIKNKQTNYKTKPQISAKYANTCTTPALLTVQSFLLPPILNACINTELTSSGSFMFVLFEH